MNYSHESRMDDSDIDIDWVALLGSWVLAWGGLALGLHPLFAIGGTLYALYLWATYHRKRDEQLEL